MRHFAETIKSPDGKPGRVGNRLAAAQHCRGLLHFDDFGTAHFGVGEISFHRSQSPTVLNIPPAPILFSPAYPGSNFQP